MNELAAETFMTALQKIEETREVQPLVELFSDDCSLTNLAMGEPLKGHSGAEQFWRQYLHVFRTSCWNGRPKVSSITVNPCNTRA